MTDCKVVLYKKVLGVFRSEENVYFTNEKFSAEK